MNEYDIFNTMSIGYISQYCETNNISLIINDGLVVGAIKEQEEAE